MSIRSKISEKLPWALFLVSLVAMIGGVLIMHERPDNYESGITSRAVAASGGDNQQAPDFEVSALGGGRIHLKEFRGKVVIIDFWSINCGPCLIANRHLAELYRKYNSLGLEIVGLSIDSYPEAVQNFLKGNPISYPVGMATDQIISDYGGIFAIPQTYVLDKSGRIANKFEGFSDLSAYQMDKLVKKLLE